MCGWVGRCITKRQKCLMGIGTTSFVTWPCHSVMKHTCHVKSVPLWKMADICAQYGLPIGAVRVEWDDLVHHVWHATHLLSRQCVMARVHFCITLALLPQGVQHRVYYGHITMPTLIYGSSGCFGTNSFCVGLEYIKLWLILMESFELK